MYQLCLFSSLEGTVGVSVRCASPSVVRLQGDAKIRSRLETVSRGLGRVRPQAREPNSRLPAQNCQTGFCR